MYQFSISVKSKAMVSPKRCFHRNTFDYCILQRLQKRIYCQSWVDAEGINKVWWKAINEFLNWKFFLMPLCNIYRRWPFFGLRKYIWRQYKNVQCCQLYMISCLRNWSFGNKVPPAWHHCHETLNVCMQLALPLTKLLLARR